MHLKHPLKERRGKFRIDKITYPKPSCRTTYYLSKKNVSVSSKENTKSLTLPLKIDFHLCLPVIYLD